MDMDMAERGGVEWVSKFSPVKGSSLKTANDYMHELYEGFVLPYQNVITLYY